MRRVAVTALLGAMLSGCAPFTIYDSSNYEIQVVDKRTNAPIPGENVTIVAKQDRKQLASAVTASDGSARFAAVSHTEWLPPLPIDFIFEIPDIRVAADGYAAMELSGADPLFAFSGCTVGDACSVDLRRYKATIALSAEGAAQPIPSR